MWRGSLECEDERVGLVQAHPPKVGLKHVELVVHVGDAMVVFAMTIKSQFVRIKNPINERVFSKRNPTICGSF